MLRGRQETWEGRMRCTTMLLGAVVIAGCATSRTPRLRTVAALEVRSPQTGVYVTAVDFDAGRLADEELTRYDDFHHEYRVARLLRETLP